MKKTIALLLACLLIVGMFAGCTQAETDEKGSVYYLNFKPEFNDALTELAAKYTAKTGIEVKIVTAASGDYNNTLTSNIKDVTIFNIGNAAALADWDEYALDLTDSAIAKELTTNDFNLYNADGELKAIGNCYESFGIIVNTKLLGDAGYELSDITDYASLKTVVEDIHARAAELGFDAFTTSGLQDSSSWRFSGHLATLPLHYEGVKSAVATITGEKLDLFKNVWDLYINNAAADPTTLTGESDAAAEFKAGKAVFYQNGTWEYAGLKEAGMTDDQLAMIPIYCGAENDAKSALCSGTENCWAINAKASKADQKASIDFLVWLVTDAEASRVYVDQLGAVPFKNCPASSNKFVADGNAMLAAGKTSISWAFNYTPNVDAWRATVVTALAAYSAGTAEWSTVVEAFVDGWAYEYGVVNG
ncbi:MAG: ABC transporter substrate-binding protein [Ruminococcaceae bacterium]|nr:ABC transporter substrate-binding protein [Oscillospiraceae bacterium]